MLATNRFSTAHLADPVGLDMFLSRYWEREALHIARRDPRFYAGLFSISDLDTLLVQSRMTSSDLRVFSKASGLDFDALHRMDRPGQERNRGPDVRSLHEAYGNGKSIIVELRRLWPDVDRLCRSLEQTFRRKVSAELYLTPKHSQAFDVHYDLVDVFLLQIEGAKTWHVYDPIVEAPSPVHRDGRNCAGRVGEPRHVCEVKAGDLLYMPYGFPHQGLTSDAPSLHISIGVKRSHVHDFLKVLVDLAAADHAVMRQSLRGAFADPGEAGVDPAAIGECLRLLQDEGLVHRALRHVEDSFIDGLDQVPDGQFAEIDGIEGITPQTSLAHHEGQICTVSADGESATIRFIGGGVSGPAWLEEPFNWMAATPRFRAEEIPGDMDEEGRLLIVRRLVREGLLRIAGRREDGGP